MAKKKTARKAATRKAVARNAIKGKARKAKAATSARGRSAPRATRSTKSRAKTPEQQELIQGVRYTDLDRLCRSIGDTRDEINRIKGEDADLGLKAIRAMRLHGVTTYKQAGITLMLVPGYETLRVLKDRAGKASSGTGAAAPQEDEQPPVDALDAEGGEEADTVN